MKRTWENIIGQTKTNFLYDFLIKINQNHLEALYVAIMRPTYCTMFSYTETSLCCVVDQLLKWFCAIRQLTCSLYCAFDLLLLYWEHLATRCFCLTGISWNQDFCLVETNFVPWFYSLQSQSGGMLWPTCDNFILYWDWDQLVARFSVKTILITILMLIQN